ncbi:MAG TPA: S8 family serine peptidase [Anaerolineae bacterium]|nr:S8 family serine peptidase [Anaerolineae bacterium]
MRHGTGWLKVLIVCGLIVTVIAGTFRLATATTADLPPDEVVIKLRANVAIGAITSRYNATVIGQLTENRVYFLKLPAGQTASNLLPALNADADLVYAEPNYYVDPPPAGGQSYIDAHGEFPNEEQSYIDAHSVFLDVNQSYIDAHGSPSGGTDRWAWNTIGLADAQKISTGQGMIVAVLDSGLAADHPLLNSNLTAGYDFVGMTNQIYDFGNNVDDDGDGKIDEGTGHGTHISGIIVSAAPGVQIMPIRVLNSDGVGTYWEVAAGVRYAVDHGAQVINMSLSAPRLPPSLQDALDYATAHGVIVVTAAGTGSGPNYPAAYANPLVLGVGASDKGDIPAAFSGGRSIDTDVYAPGMDIYSSYPYNGYVYGSGTSMAAAIVSAEAALLRAHYPTWTPAQVSQRIISKVAPVSGTLPGRVDLAAALSTGLEVQYQIGDIGVPDDNSLKPRWQIVNNTTITVPLSELKLRYWYTNEGDKSQSFSCDYSPIGCGNITGSFTKLAAPQNGADTYVEVGFTTGAGVLAPGKISGEIVARMNKTDWSNYNEIGDYSYDPAHTAYAAWTHVTLYRNGQLIWGVEPGGAAPSATATQTAVSSTATRTATATVTQTPVPPTVTRTATQTSTPLPTTTRTATATQTPVQPTATRTATQTSTPVPAATQTATSVPTASMDTYALNSGGSAAGIFAIDAYVSGGSTYTTNTTIDTSGVANPAPQAVYQTERWSSSTFTYTLSSLTPGHSYLLRLHFTELVMSGPNQRQFNVTINNMPLLNNYDIFAAAGAQYKAVVWEISVAANSAGQIIVVFSKGNRDNPKVNGIEIIRQ